MWVAVGGELGMLEALLATHNTSLFGLDSCGDAESLSPTSEAEDMVESGSRNEHLDWNLLQ